jgi:hypothetical protein
MSRCVPMTFNGTSHGGYCLQRVGSGCTQPYSVTVTAASLSGAASEAYCGINQALTTCEAVLDLTGSKICTASTECGCSRDSSGACTAAGIGGLCQVVGSLAGTRCTIPCGSNANCLSQPPGDTCTTAIPYCH